MTQIQQSYSRVTGTGGYLPERILSNAELEKMVDTTEEWIVTRTGIHERRIAAEHESTCDLAEHAAREALSNAGIAATDLDLIIVATTTPDLVFPSTACLLQARLGNRGAPAFDIQAVCTGFIYALDVADKFIRTGAARRALIVGAETMSRIVDWQDRSTCVLFGDGAGAVVLEAGLAPGILSTHIHADGAYSDLLAVPAGISCNSAKLRAGEAHLTMKGNPVFRMAVKTLGEIVDETLSANCMGRGDIDWLVPHQANIRIIQATAEKLGLPMDRVVVTVDRHGNTSGASIPLALHAAAQDGRIQPGETVLMEAFGGGFTWGSVLLKWA